MKEKPTVYQFTDYRRYLEAYYLYHKEHGNRFSYRAMSKQLGFTSPNYLKLIIDGERHIGKNAIDKISSGLDLKKVEKEYFTYLIFFAKSKTEVDRNWYFAQISRLRAGKIAVSIQESQLAYYEHWYNCVIRELISGTRAEDVDFGALARKLSPPIHHKQAQQSVHLLEELNFISVDENGYYRQSSPLLNTTNEISSYAVKQYHREMIDFGKNSIDDHPRENREIASVTVKVSEDGFCKIKQRLQEFREEILHMVESDQNVDRVAQVNFQLFPLTAFNSGESDDK